MKTTIVLGILVFVTLSFSFHETTKKKNHIALVSARVNDTIDTMPPTAVTIEAAIESIQRYVRIAGQLYINDSASQDSIVRAFTIPYVDLIGVLGESTPKRTIAKYTHCRVYLGLDSIPLSNKNFYFKNKLFMVPVKDSFDVNLFYKTNDTQKKYQQFVYDLIAPCPKTCDEESPLYTLIPLK